MNLSHFRIYPSLNSFFPCWFLFFILFFSLLSPFLHSSFYQSFGDSPVVYRSPSSLLLSASSSLAFSSISANFSVSFGGGGNDQGRALALDSSDNSFLVGSTNSVDFPTLDAFQSSYGGGLSDAIIAKIDSSGNLIFGSFFGGNDSDIGFDVAVDSFGYFYIVGETSSPDFPMKNDFNVSFNGGSYPDVFLSKFDSSGHLIFSTFLGGNLSDVGFSVAIDRFNNIYVTGSTQSSNFPLLNSFQNSFGGRTDVFVSKFNSTGFLLFSTFLGGSFDDYGHSIGVDSYGNCYITGFTRSPDFPTKNAYNSTYGGNFDSFITKLSPTGNIIFSSYFGGSSNDESWSLSVDDNGFFSIGGSTSSSNFPIKNAIINRYLGSTDTFIAKFDTSGNLLFSSFFGGSFRDYSSSIIFDSFNNNYILGTIEINLLDALYPKNFIAIFDSNNKLIFNITLDYFDFSGNEIARDNDNNIFVIGSRSNNIFYAKFSSLLNLAIKQDEFQTEYYLIGSIAFVTLVGISSYIFIKYKNFKKSDYKVTNQNNITFVKFLKIKFSRKSKISSTQYHDIEKILKIIEEIEKETEP